jgi:uncharacterized protein YdcH (DUF465 family)
MEVVGITGRKPSDIHSKIHSVEGKYKSALEWYEEHAATIRKREKNPEAYIAKGMTKLYKEWQDVDAFMRPCLQLLMKNSVKAETVQKVQVATPKDPTRIARRTGGAPLPRFQHKPAVAVTNGDDGWTPIHIHGDIPQEWPEDAHFHEKTSPPPKKLSIHKEIPQELPRNIPIHDKVPQEPLNNLPIEETPPPKKHKAPIDLEVVTKKARIAEDTLNKMKALEDHMARIESTLDRVAQQVETMQRPPTSSPDTDLNNLRLRVIEAKVELCKSLQSMGISKEDVLQQLQQLDNITM